MTFPASRLRTLGVGVFAFAACVPEKPAPVYECIVHVSSDPETSLANVPLFRDGTYVGSTDSSGAVRLRLQGIEGETVTFRIECPKGFRQPSESVPVVLKSTSDRGRVPEYFTNCPPEVLKVVVAVRAEGGPNLPILFLGQEVARTDSSGTAHVSLSLPPNSQFELTLSTSEQLARQLRPQNPIATFLVRDRDDILPLAQHFTAEPLAKTAKRSPRPTPEGPVRLK